MKRDISPDSSDGHRTDELSLALHELPGQSSLKSNEQSVARCRIRLNSRGPPDATRPHPLPKFHKNDSLFAAKYPAVHH